MGGKIGNPRNGYRVRCENKPVWYAVEKRPGPDGLIGSMSLCDNCQKHMELQMPGHANFTRIEESDGNQTSDNT
jgi:hypothetical protein